MTIHAGVGKSNHRNPKIAAKEAVERALKAGEFEKADFAFMFATVGYPQKALVQAVRKELQGTPMCGCSAEGVITPYDADENNFAVSILLIHSDTISFSNGFVENLRENSGEAGKKIAEQVTPHLNPKASALFLFPDGITVNFDQLLRSFEKNLPVDKTLPIFGGAAGENWQGGNTYQYCNDEVISDGASWALLSGDVNLLMGINHGCVPMGNERKITQVEGNKIYEIDNKPILDVLNEYVIDDEVGNWNKALFSLAMGCKTPNFVKEFDSEYEHVIMRFAKEGDDYLTTPMEIPEGTSIWVMRRDYEKITKGLEHMCDELLSKFGEKTPSIVFYFDCAGRGKAFFREQQKQDLLKKLQDKLGTQAAWIGFYTYGEIGCVSDCNRFHNYTAVLLALCEK